MYSILFLACILFALALLVHNTHAACNRGPSYYDGCNTCSCYNGQYYICTLRYCP
ncbi:hypothetical protein C0J52_16538 [Blattella germanica]|nr:hypothetical protein C0J52_16538 [Blattella germanica]